MPKITHWQHKYPEHAKLIGVMLTGYGEIEFELCECVSSAVGSIDLAVRAMFRMRNESQRIDLADALLTPTIQKFKLVDEYAHALGAIRHCRKLRNQYAHCHWDGDMYQKLCFVDLENAAKSKSGPAILTFKDADIDLMKDQASYFDYCSDWLVYISHEIDLRSGRVQSHGYSAPAIKQQPSL